MMAVYPCFALQPKTALVNIASRTISEKGQSFRYKEAINECSAALDAQPTYYKALARRAKAYEHMGLYKQALSDIQKANKHAEATPESQVHLRNICGAEYLYCPSLFIISCSQQMFCPRFARGMQVPC